MGEAQRTKRQPQQKQAGLTCKAFKVGGHTYHLCLLSLLSLSSVPVWTTNGTATLLTGHIKGSVPRTPGIPGGLTITLPARPEARPASLGGTVVAKLDDVRRALLGSP